MIFSVAVLPNDTYSLPSNSYVQDIMLKRFAVLPCLCWYNAWHETSITRVQGFPQPTNTFAMVKAIHI